MKNQRADQSCVRADQSCVRIASLVILLLAVFMTADESRSQKGAAPVSSTTAARPGAKSKMPAPLSSYTWITPIAGLPTIPVLTRGVTYTLKWSGGPPGPVKISVFNWCTLTTQLWIVGSAPNTHSYSWTVPLTLPCGIFYCNIQNASGPPAAWSHSSNFAVTMVGS
jgi:hypothetical protein